MAPAGLSRRSHALSAGNGGAQPSAMPWFWVERPSAHPGLDQWPPERCPAVPHSESALGGNWALELLCPVEFSAMLRILRRVNGVADTGTAAAAGGEDVHIV